ncbi:tRNA1(Val) (adenine(37)-N6)-methyltransferase [anaerobic digester metagenome]
MFELFQIEPSDFELPSQYADSLGVQYAKQVTLKHKKDNGQFFTPIPIASLMASLCSIQKERIRILDPGCGTAILTCSLIEFLVNKNPKIDSIELVAYETDPKLISTSEKSLTFLKQWLEKKRIEFHYILHISDFVLENASALRNIYKQHKFDVIISNPPYFKLSKEDEKSVAAREIVSGQPNIYAFFLGISSKLLEESGELIFITPRSFASGNYFNAFRQLFFNTIQIQRIHLFSSRRETFNRDSVLQETVILKGVKETINPNKEVTITYSYGLNDLESMHKNDYNYSSLIDLESKEMILHLPTNENEIKVFNLISSWSNTLRDFNIQISTGPVVAFRAKAFIKDVYENGTKKLVPLFWLHNVNKMFLEWPKIIKEKGQFISCEQSSRNLLVPNKDYIFLRRFSTKDDKSRLIAAPYFSNSTNSENIGIENKVNYLYRKNGYMERKEVVGLCALLNSELFDTYFRIFNGNVNVSATELREMRFPSLVEIKEIGNRIILSNDYSMTNVNQIVNEIFEFELIYTWDEQN